MTKAAKRESWLLDQLARSTFFHQKLHEWGVVQIGEEIQKIKGEELVWNQRNLRISKKAWAKVIHRGIKPIVVFAHPDILRQVQGAGRYYRMIAMISQKSMTNIGLPVNSDEQNGIAKDLPRALAHAQRFNEIVSLLIEADQTIDAREFDVWRGMAAGSQAQGSWGAKKGDTEEVLVKSLLKQRLQDKNLIHTELTEGKRFQLKDGRVVVFAGEPDVAVYKNDRIQIALEIKGGIDTAAVLERAGAAVKSLSRAKAENPKSVTILLVKGVSVTEQAIKDLKAHTQEINHWFRIDDITDPQNAKTREALFSLLRF